MITDAILDMVEGFIRFVLNLFPRWSPDVGGLVYVNAFFPVDWLMWAFGILWGMAASGLIIWGVMKVANLLRGAGA